MIKKSKLAIFSFVCSLIGVALWGLIAFMVNAPATEIGDFLGNWILVPNILFTVVPFITSIISLRTIKKYGFQGKWFSIIALIISSALILMSLWLLWGFLQEEMRGSLRGIWS